MQIPKHSSNNDGPYQRNGTGGKRRKGSRRREAKIVKLDVHILG